MKNSNIKFFWNGCFVGTSLYMFVGRDKYNLGEPFAGDYEKAKDEAVKILKEKYEISYNREDIEFEWGGKL